MGTGAATTMTATTITATTMTATTMPTMPTAIRWLAARLAMLGGLAVACSLPACSSPRATASASPSTVPPPSPTAPPPTATPPSPTAPPEAAAGALQPLAPHYQAMLRADDRALHGPPLERFAAVAAEYERGFAAAATQPLGARSAEDLEALFGAAERMTNYFAEPRYVAAMAAALAELEHRGAATPKHITRLFPALLQTRQLERARALRGAHPAAALPAVPTLRSVSSRVAAAPRLWAPAPGATDAAPALLERDLDVSRDAQILVVANPFCHFALAAVAALDADAELAPLFAARSTWLTPQDGFFAIDEANAWNRAHPALPIAFSAARDEWPLIDDWATPTFYFLARGRLVAKVSGWPKEGRRAELLAALHQLGLLSPRSSATR